MPNKAEIAAEIAREERRMAELRAESERTARRLETLKSKLATDQSEGHETAQVLKPGSQPTEILTIPEKITLFRTLFRGREDVFARRWENLRTGKTGYAPACTNDFKRGICEKLGSPGEKKHPGLVCGTCRRQAFIPVSDDEIERHLRGGQLMGIYPLLLDERCWLLAIDFDGDSWLEDLQSYSDVCTREGVPVSRERSRSGHGGHLWIFFGEAVPAYTARALGSFLLTETISHRHQVSLGSYDRFFPNQDTLPTGGFGNLIALPLQRQPRDKGNTVFLNQSLTPYSDQWEYLRSVKRVDREIAFELASSAQQRKTIIAVPEPSAYPDLLLEKPDRTTLSSASKPASMGHWPSSIIMVLSHRLYVPKAGLPSALIATLKSFAAFQNPEFYRRQGMRLSTALTPRIISCFEETDSVLALPRGCLDRVSELIRELGITLHIDDQRESGSFRSFEFKGKLSSLESEAAEALLKHEMGVFVAPPGLGKTVVGAFLIAARKTSTLVLVHRQELLRLWVIQLAHFLGIETKEIGRLGAGTKSLNGQLDVAMVPSVIHRGEVRVPLSSYGHVVADECHHVSSVSFEQVLNSSNPRFLTGLTATPQRRDGHHPIIYMQLGPVRYSVAPRRQAGLHQFEHRLIVRETPFDVEVHTGSKAPIQELYSALVNHERRNDLIFDDVLSALEEHRSPILLTERRDHLEYFARRFSKFVRNLIVLHGQMKVRDKKDILTRLTAVPRDEERLILATGRYLGEGFDDARLDTLFLALPVAWKGTLIQYSGRLHRARPGKDEVRIYDYVDRSVPVLLKMFEKRMRGYRSIGYNAEFCSALEP